MSVTQLQNQSKCVVTRSRQKQTSRLGEEHNATVETLKIVVHL